MRKFLTQLIDQLYPPFRSIMPIQTFRYAACGGGNTVLGLLTYFLSFEYLFKGEIFDFGFYAFEPHIAALFLSGLLSFTVGFILNKYVVFTSSEMRGRIQLFRYFITFFINLVINYAMLKLLVEYLAFDAKLSQLFTTVVVILISYFGQKHFTFRVK